MINTEQTIEHLVNGEIVVTGRLIDASNATLYSTCTYKNRSITCIYKPEAGERPLWDFASGTLAQREVAAFLLSNGAGFNLVPPTILREGPFGPGAIQAWIDIDESVNLAELFSQDDKQLRKLALFDAVINNTDRKIGHLLPDLQGHLYACDHGVTFHEENKLRTVLWQWAGVTFNEEDRGLLLASIDFVINQAPLFMNLISEVEYGALLQRMRALDASGVFPSPNPDWPSIPWPAF